SLCPDSPRPAGRRRPRRRRPQARDHGDRTMSRPASLLAAIPLIAGVTAVAARATDNLPLPVDEELRRLRDDDFTIASVKSGGGVMGAKKLQIRFADGTTIDAKWKETGPAGDSWNNSPRREIGAYAAQLLFLDPDDFIVPPVVVRCIPLDVYRVVDEEHKPTL